MGSAATVGDAPQPHSPSVSGKDVVDQLGTSKDGRKPEEGASEVVQDGASAASEVISVEAAAGRVGLDQGEVLRPDSVPGQNRKRNKKERSGKRRKNAKEGGTEDMKTEETIGNAEVIFGEADDFADNMVLKKLLRWPRYFDTGNQCSGTCYNCGEEGHLAKDCNVEKRKRPCFICGLFGHAAKTCTLGINCYICNKSGHIAKDCPEKHQKTSRCSNICLRCGNFGHDMFSCANEYSHKDIEEIQCYICNKFGHLCCYEVSYIRTGQTSCYNCGQSGHSGAGCAKTHKEKGGTDPPSTCYVCGEEGHFARGCTKEKAVKRLSHQKDGSDQVLKQKKEKRTVGSKSAPSDFRWPQKKKHKRSESDRWNPTSGKSRIKGGWIVDDPGDYTPYNKFRGNKWDSPLTPYKNGRSHSFSAEERYSETWSAYKKPRGYARTSIYSTDHYQSTPESYDGSTHHRYGSSSRFFKSSRKYWRS